MSSEDVPPSPITLDELRLEINRLDKELLSLLGRRRRIAAQVIEVKRETGRAVRDELREQELLNRWVSTGEEEGLDPYFVSRIFHEVVSDSLRSQQLYLQNNLNQRGRIPKKVAYHGIEGSYCVLAAREIYASTPEIEFKGYPSFEQVVGAVVSEEVDEAVIPVENDDYGRLPEVFHLLAESSLFIIGEARYRVDHALLGLPEGVPLRTLLCSPFAFADCQSFITTIPHLQVEHLPDSAIAAQQVKERGDPSVAAIASQEAGRIYGLKVLQREVSDRPGLLVRYMVVGRESYKVDPRVPSKTSIILSTPQSAGSLVEALLVFREQSINLTRLESRTARGGEESQLFYIDFEGNVASEAIQTALRKLEKVSATYKVLGCYPSLDLPRVAVSVDGRNRPDTPSS